LYTLRLAVHNSRTSTAMAYALTDANAVDGYRTWS